MLGSKAIYRKNCFSDLNIGVVLDSTKVWHSKQTAAIYIIIFEANSPDISE